MATSKPNLMKMSETAAELWRFSFFSKMAAGRHLGFCYTSKVALQHVADCPCLPPGQIWWQCLKWRPSYCDVPFFKMAAGRHPSWFGPTDLQDHSRWRLDGLKRPVKFRIDLTYYFEDIENLIFLTFGLKSPNHAHFLGGFIGFLYPEYFFSSKPPKGTSLVKPHRLRYRSWKSVNPFLL